MKVIILAGGYGTRLGEVTDLIPKPMVEIGGKPIIIHIMELYAHYGHTDFYIALGYKADVIKKYFNENTFDWDIKLHDTGLHTATGGRAKQVSRFLDGEKCFLTYGDGLANINLDALLDFHKKHGKLVTVTAVRPPARFGAIKLNGNRVTDFKEKSKMEEGWINGGFFIIEPSFFDFIEGDDTYLEREPLARAAKEDELFAYKHEDFWQCMDTKRDRDNLEEIYKKGAPWIT